MIEAVQNNPSAAVIWQEMRALADRQEVFNELVQVSPLLPASSPLLPGYEIFVKNEGAQQGRAYKVRGAYNCMLAARENGESFNGVVAASTGNHIKGVALAARHLGVDEVVGFCPEGTVPEKIAGVEAVGVSVKTASSLAQATAAAENYARDNGMLFVHPYDHPAVVAGNGTAALEAVAQLAAFGVDPADPNTEITVVVPGGGGGLAAGSVVGLAALYPTVRTVVSQLQGGDNLARRIRRVAELPAGDFSYACRGAAVYTPGTLATTVLTDRQFAVGAVSVTPGEVGRAMKRLSRYHETPESAGALAMATVTQLAERNPVAQGNGKRRVRIAITTGTNPGADELVEFAQAAEQERREQLAAAQQNFALLSDRQLTDKHARVQHPNTPKIFKPRSVRAYRASLNVISGRRTT
ncbi:MAG TPA: pyridoxal-phosphate dependent enzyme [Candidatus Saccharimonadales bacterium]|nr:pyridoxal-phosphate dependent enzyme [Candidatus Saccharimonadales bacterium]